jgi:anion-transporting  ArsA/GET3 family ATPase
MYFQISAASNMSSTPDASRNVDGMQMQNKYLEQYDDLYGEDMHLVKMPLLKQEVRGVKSLSAFSEMLLEPYKQEAQSGSNPFARIAELEQLVAELKRQLGQA